MKSLLAILIVLLSLPAFAADTTAPVVKRVFLPPHLHLGDTGINPVQPIDEAAWIWHPAFANLSKAAHAETFSAGWRGPVLLRFRKTFAVTAAPLRLHVSADERFELFLDGQRIARGPDRSDIEHWSYATYEIRLTPGRHRLEALVWSIGPHAPVAQISWRGGFVLKAEGAYDKQLTTGKTPWEVARLDGFEFTPGIFFVGAQLTAHGCGPQWKEGDYVKAQVIRSPIGKNPYGESAAGWKLFPTTLPDQFDREVNAGRAVALGSGMLGKGDLLRAEQTKHSDLPKWQALVAGQGEVVVPPNTERFLLWDLENYFCAYPLCEVSGGAGAKLAWSWAEALYLPNSEAKGNRGEFIGKNFRGMTDTFLPEGGTHKKFSTLWWRAGRWCLISVKTAAEPLTLHRLALDENRYPYENEGRFDGGDDELAGVIRLAVRGIQMCSHETYMDCPFYEQLMYDGDTRLELLTTNVMTRDDRLVKRAIELFDFSRRNWGFVNERFPAYLPQHSPTFSMIWAMMLSDYASWHNDLAFVRARAIGLRSMLEHFEPYLNRDGLLENLPGWPFMDWVPQWDNGNAPDGVNGISALNNLLYVAALQKSADVEDGLGEPLLAQRLRGKAARTAAAVKAKFWDEARGLIADNLAHTEFSEHGQCLALLTDTLTGDQAKRCFEQLLSARDLKRTTIYFSFYLLETWRKFGRGDLIVERMKFWKDLVKQGLKTPVEMPGDTRSDCHAWGSHPLFHLHASVAGIRPASPGFRTVRIAPLPGKLPKIVSSTPHPDGFIKLDLAFDGNRCRGSVELPAAITGVFAWQGMEQKLSGGTNAVDLHP
ncbi:MAG: hypothetical protein ABSG53_10640 [Thermoguttaceae bacterium]|jgi:hypothetical protein